MNSLYVIIVSLLVYILVIRRASGKDFRPFLAAIIVVFMPFIFAKVLWFIYLTGFELPLSQLISFGDVIILITQFGLAYIIFHRIQQSDDNLISWFFWGSTGMVGIYFALPFLVRLVVPI